MSKRGRRRYSRRRRSSSSSKQNVTSIPYFSFKQDKNSVGYKHNALENGEKECLGKGKASSGSDDGKCNNAPLRGTRRNQDHISLFQNQSTYTTTTEHAERVVKIVTSVSVDNMNDTPPKITFQQSQEPLGENPHHSASPVININCIGPHVKLEIQEITQHNTRDINTTVVVINDKEVVPERIGKIKDEQKWSPNNKHQLQDGKGKSTSNYRLSNSEGTTKNNIKSTTISPSYCQYSDHDEQISKYPSSLANIKLRSSTCSTTDTPQRRFNQGPMDCDEKSGHTFYDEMKLKTDVAPSSDEFSESDNSMSMRPSLSINSYSFTNDFIERQKGKSCVRHNSVATIEHREGLISQRRCQTFPNMSVDRSLTHKDLDFVDKADQNAVTDSRFDQETGDVGCRSPDPCVDHLSQRELAIQVIPPSCSGSEEQVVQGHSVFPGQNSDENENENAKATNGLLRQTFLIDSKLGLGGCMQGPNMATLQHTEGFSLSTFDHVIPKAIIENPHLSLSLRVEKTRDPQLDNGSCCSEDFASASFVANGFLNTDTNIQECPNTNERPDKTSITRCSLQTKEHLNVLSIKNADSATPDSWARRRKLFKNSKQWSSAGGSSFTSDITEESEDINLMDLTIQDDETRGFYAETFHSTAWLYQGEKDVPGSISSSLNTQTPAVSIRERTVKINKGTGDYPWGFRIQFSKPIVVTEVDTNGAAEEAGLMVGDYVLAVNGIDVTSISHSEAANLARQGPEELTLTIGSDIGRSPNTPRPACRGYLHKRTQSGLIRGWRKRWFVLTHDCWLYYYRHKRDEGKSPALAALKMEGAEVGPDLSLGKPFVLKCHPVSANRVYHLCATSNQEMKKWLEAMERAIHPIIQHHVWLDVTRHNSSLPPLAVKNPECLGLLHKMDKSKHIWMQHYSILKDGCLYLYSGIRATHAHGGIYLQGYMVREQHFGGKKSTIELKPPSDEFKTFYFCADNPNETKRWIIALKASINKWLPLHQALRDYLSQPPEATRM